MALRRSTQNPSPADPTLTSRLLPELFSGWDVGDRLTVLDLGAGAASTVEFLSRFKAKIYFADLLEHPHLLASSEDRDPAAIRATIQRQLDLPADTRVDICLLWDYLHYIDIPTIAALSAVLQPVFHSRTRGYGFGALHGDKPSDANKYGIAGFDRLLARPIRSEPEYFAHSQQRIGEHFPALRIARGTLLREGRLELLFESP